MRKFTSLKKQEKREGRVIRQTEGDYAMAEKEKIAEKAEEMKPWIRRFGRFGHMAKGMVYALVGLLALMAAAGIGGETTGTSGALSAVAEKPFGKLLLWLIGIGLIGYSLWEILKSVKDLGHNGRKAKGVIKRIGYLISAAVYGSLALKAFKLAMKTGSSGGSEKTISAMLLAQPFGQWMVGLLGLIMIIYGCIEFYRGIQERFMKYFKGYEMDGKKVKIARYSGKAGLTARSIVLAMTGFFFIKTAVTANPNETKGLGGSLAELASQPFGPLLLGATAIGLILYGIYEIIRGRYQRMDFGKR